MDPSTVRGWQAIPYSSSACLLAFLFGAQGAVGVLFLTVALMLVWLGLERSYEARRHVAVSPGRLEGDGRMEGNLWIAVVPALIGSSVLAVLDLEAILRPGWAAWTLNLPLLAILLSSSIDWYVVLPFRNGVTGLPVCRAQDVDLRVRRRYTKIWLGHRLICEMTIAASLAISAVLITHHYAADLKPLISAIAFVGLATVVLSAAHKRWIRGALRFCLSQSPAIGSWVFGPITSKHGHRDRTGFVRDVSLDNGLKIVETADGDELFIALADAVPDITVGRPGGPLCADNRCGRWLKNGNADDCEIHLMRLAASTESTAQGAPGEGG